MANSPSLFSVAAINTMHDQMQLGERKGLFGLPSPSYREAWAETEKEAVEEAASWLAPDGFLSYLSYIAQDHLPTCHWTAYTGLGPPISVNNQETPPHTHTQDAHRPVS